MCHLMQLVVIEQKSHFQAFLHRFSLVAEGWEICSTPYNLRETQSHMNAPETSLIDGPDRPAGLKNPEKHYSR